MPHDTFVRRLSHQLGTVQELKKSDGTILKRPARTTSPEPSLTLRVVSPDGARCISPELITFDGKLHQEDWSESSNKCKWCYRLYEGTRHDTKLSCKDGCGHFCSNLTGRDCFKQHQQHGIPPLHLNAKGERMRSHWEKIKSTDLNRVKRRGSNKQARKVTPKGQNKKRKKK